MFPDTAAALEQIFWMALGLGAVISFWLGRIAGYQK